MADAAERERARIMAKARRSGTRSLTSSELAKLTPGQKQKLGIGVTQTDIYRNTNPVTNPPAPTPGKVVDTPQGPRLAPASDPRPDTAPSPSSTGKPAFNGYTPDSVYNDSMSILAANRKTALDAADAGEKTLAQEYGLGINQTDDGANYSGTWAASDATRGGIDPSNPFSRASLLNRSYFTAGRAGQGSYATRGLLTSGAYQRNQQRDAFNFESGKDALLKQFAAGLQGYRSSRANARSTYDTSSLSARNDLFNRNRDLYDRLYPS
jgi:hypothetical protein